ncbi:MAG: hypothetical protein AABX59_00935 [Nanoarchaeota archaeon]
MAKLRSRGYSILDVVTPEGEELDMFVGRRQGNLRFLGYRSAGSPYHSEQECTALDLGLVKLPEGKNSLSDLVEGDIIHVEMADGNPNQLDCVTYKSMDEDH